MAADAGLHADVDLDVALGAGFGEAARFGLLDFDFELALGAELFGTGGIGEVDRTLRVDAVAGERRLAADGAEFASGLGRNDRFWFEDAHMAPISGGWQGRWRRRSVIGFGYIHCTRFRFDAFCSVCPQISGRIKDAAIQWNCGVSAVQCNRR